MAINGRSTIANEVDVVYTRQMLEIARPNLIFRQIATQAEYFYANPGQMGTLTAKWRRYEKLTPNTTPLSEGVTPNGSGITVTNVTVTPEQYGDYSIYTDKLAMTSQDQVVLEFAGVLGQEMMEIENSVLMDAYDGGSQVKYPSTHTQRSDITATDYLTATMMAQVTTLLETANAKYYLPNMINATTGIGTSPIHSAYIAVVHTRVAYSVRKFTNFIPVEKYASTQAILPGEIGALGNIRYVQTTEAPVYEDEGSGGTVDVYGTLVFGANAVGATNCTALTMGPSGELAPAVTQFLHKELGSSGVSDALNQRGSVGFKTAIAGTILNQNWIYRLESAVEAVS
jgi:N4-gp56 family major capsid protein